MWPPFIPKVRAQAEAVEVLTTAKIKDAETLPPEEPQDEHQLIVFLVAAALLGWYPWSCASMGIWICFVSHLSIECGKKQTS